MKAIYFKLRGSSLSSASSNGEKITMVCFGVILSMLFFLQHKRGAGRGSEKKKDGRVGGKMKRRVVWRNNTAVLYFFVLKVGVSF